MAEGADSIVVTYEGAGSDSEAEESNKKVAPGLVSSEDAPDIITTEEAPDIATEDYAAELEELEKKVQVKSQQSLRSDAEKHRRSSACTVYSQDKNMFEYLRVCGTKITDLGVYGVGVTLYFQFLLQMGLVFLFCAVITGPNLAINFMGNMVDEENPLFNAIGRISLANLGACESGSCDTSAAREGRCWANQFPCTMQLRDVTLWLGLADGLAILVFLAWAVFFQRWWLPRTVRKNDEKHTTPSDFTVDVSILPRRLAEGHETYEAKLREHFLAVLRGMQEPIDDQDAVVQVALVRDFRGYISRFMTKGKMIHELQDSVTRRKLSVSSGNSKLAEKEGKKAEKIQKRLSISDEKIHKLRRLETDRDVVRAFVTFSREDYAQAVVREYRFSTYSLFRCCQRAEHRFEGKILRVARACEPSDLFWENLDYAWWKRILRKAFVLLLSFILLAICSLLLVYFQSQSKALGRPEAYPVWIVKSTPGSDVGCLELCDLEFFDDRNCVSNGLTSDSWPMVKKFDARNDWQKSNLSSPWTNGCAGKWTSPTCATWGEPCNSSTADWYGFEFTEPRLARCMKAGLAASAPAKELQLFGCAQPPPSIADRACWRVEDYCEPMVADIDLPPPVANAPFTSTGNLKIDPDVSCSTTVGVDAAKAKWSSLEASLRVTSPLISCFCKQQMTLVGPQFRFPPYDTDEKKICEDWSYAENMKLVGLVGTALAVLVVNSLLVIVYEMLVTWERNCTVTDVALSQLTKLFAAQFVNTGLLVLFVNANIKEMPAILVPLRVLSIGTGYYDDLSIDWYVTIGSSLAITILGQVFSTTIPPLVKSFCLHPILSRIFSRGVVLQDQMNEIYELPEWNLSLRMAQTLTVVFMVSMYSAGMPVLWAIGFLYCIVAFWLDKWCLLRGSRKPPAYTESVINTCMHFVPVAAFLHTILACWSFGNQSLFPSPWSRIRSVAEIVFDITLAEYQKAMDVYKLGSKAAKTAGQYAYLHARILDFAREGCWLLLLVFLFFCVYYILFWVFSIFVKPFIAPFLFWLREACKRSGGEADESVSTWTQAQEGYKARNMLSAYTLGANPKYRQAFLALQRDEQMLKKNSTSSMTSGPIF